jgi:hypothetical protein
MQTTRHSMHTHALSTIHLLGKCPCGQMSFWANVFLGRCPSEQTSSGKMSFGANVLLGKRPFGKMSSGQMSFWANVFLGKRLLGKCIMGKCPSGQVSFWAKVFWADVLWANVVLGKCLWANVSGQMSLGKCRMGKCRVTSAPIVCADINFYPSSIATITLVLLVSHTQLAGVAKPCKKTLDRTRCPRLNSRLVQTLPVQSIHKC